MNSLLIKNIKINITGLSDNDFISLTDIARFKNDDDPNSVIANWLRRVDTLQFLRLWEKLNNNNFKPTDFEGFKSKPGENAFTISPKKWIELTNAIGIKAKSGRYDGGTFAHKDIALEFAAWISPEIKLYMIKEFQRLKLIESEQLEWHGKRMLTKLNYLIHTDAIKENLIKIELTKEQKNCVYASEADLLNVALFGRKASEWREFNQDKKGNIRDYASSIELAILSNLEFQNAKLIEAKIGQKERIILLNKEANREKELFNKNNEKAIYKIKNLPKIG
ncbi:MAG: KilA-N domain-containing protein [Bacilli bacterium]|nr:KilA-N domain-containing protein [Bacilli bacterium]